MMHLLSNSENEVCEPGNYIAYYYMKTIKRSSTSNKTMKKKTPSCTYCDDVIERERAKTEQIIEKINKKQKMATKSKKIFLGVFKKLINKRYTKKAKKERIEMCKSAYCNPTCSGTIYQDGEFPKELIEKYSKKENGKMLIESLKQFRKGIFNNKKTVLKDGFYENLKDINGLKKKGAISGCTLSII